MCTINPFCALRPTPEKVDKVATHAVERYSKEEMEYILSHNPISFLQVINPPHIAEQSAHDRLYSIKKNLHAFIEKNVFIQDASPCFYIYRQIKNGRHHTGIIGLASVDDYNNNVIKIHEQTLAQREEKLKEYLDVCEFNAEPVCLTYTHNKVLNDLMRAKTETTPTYDYTIDEIRHTLWVVNTPEEIEQIHAQFNNIPSIYIADGHHRAASSARLAEMRKANNPTHTGNEPYNFFTAALFADDELTIFSYNRMVQTLNGHTPDSFLSELKKTFQVTLLTERIKEPTYKNLISLYLQKQWYSINIGGLTQHTDNPAKNLDVSVLSDYILSPVLGIEDIRNDKRISFIPAVKSSEEIEKIVDSGKIAAAFCLYPVSFEELISVAYSGKEMPPKSTWIEPKLESGLLIYSFETGKTC